MQLDGRRILVTGAGSGIGRALAIGLGQKGATLILNGRREHALAATRALMPVPARTEIVATDITTSCGRAALVDACVSPSGLDVLVNNAGIVVSGRFEDLHDATLDDLIATNLIAPMILTRDLLPALRAAHTPRVINIGSIFGDIGHPLFAGYCASKFALRGLSDSLRRELAPEGIGVTYVAPRATRTEAADGFANLVDHFAMAMDTPSAVAAHIISAIERDIDRVYARGSEQLFVLVQRLIPKLIDRVLIEKYRRFTTP